MELKTTLGTTTEKQHSIAKRLFPQGDEIANTGKCPANAKG